eukprot:Opistho-2@95501
MHLLMSFRFITTAVARPFAPIASRTFVTMASPVDPAKHAGQQFLNFVHNAPSPFHAVEESRIRLTAAGFTELKEKDSWDVKQGGRYFFTRNSATIIANLAMRTIDIGSPQLSMHSIREMCATTDIVHCTSLLKAFF